MQFQKWLDEPSPTSSFESDFMPLGRADVDAQVWSQTVVPTGSDARAFSFYTNYESANGRQLAR